HLGLGSGLLKQFIRWIVVHALDGYKVALPFPADAVAAVLHEIKVIWDAGANDHAVAGCDGFAELFGFVMPPPEDNGIFGRQRRVHDFIPAQQFVPEHGHGVRHAPYEVVFNGPQVIKAVALHQSLHGGVYIPMCISEVYLIAADVDLLCREKGVYRAEDVGEVTVGSFQAGIERKIREPRGTAPRSEEHTSELQ